MRTCPLFYEMTNPFLSLAMVSAGDIFPFLGVHAIILINFSERFFIVFSPNKGSPPNHDTCKDLNIDSDNSFSVNSTIAISVSLLIFIFSNFS